MARKGAKIRAQSVSEYSIFLAIALIAIVAMNVYIKRGLQGRYADITDLPAKAVNSQVASAQKAGNVPKSYVAPAQYEPYYVDTKNIVNIPERSIDQTVTKEGKRTRDLLPGQPIVVTGKNIEGTNAAKD